VLDNDGDRLRDSAREHLARGWILLPVADADLSVDNACWTSMTSRSDREARAAAAGADAALDADTPVVDSD
jgi:hypothetical protein